MTFCYLFINYIVIFAKTIAENQLMHPLNTSVLLIYTGGTIGMIENTTTGALESFNFEQLQKHFFPDAGNPERFFTLSHNLFPLFQ